MSTDTGPVQINGVPVDLADELFEHVLKAGYVPKKEVEPGPEVTDQPINPDLVKPSSTERLKTAGQAERKPIVPEWVKTREALRSAARVAGTGAGHWVAYHGLRTATGYYPAIVAGRATVGAGKTLGRITRFVGDAEGRPLRLKAVDTGQTMEYIRLVRERNARVARRWLALVILAILVLIGSLLLRFMGPWWAQLAVTVTVVWALAKAGTPVGTKLIGPAVRKNGPPRLTDQSIALAFGSIGIGALAKMLKDGTSADLFKSPIERVTHGYRVEMDMPHGVTAAEITEKRAALAAGLRRQIGAVWPMELKRKHPGALELWVLDKPFSELPQEPWPLAAKGKADMIGGTIPFGWDQRAEMIRIGLFENNLIIGAAPGQGKTAAVLVIGSAAALDTNCELHIYEFKGTGDPGGLRPVCHRYVSSAPTDESIEACMDGLREVHSYLGPRAEAVKRAGSARAPESKVTPDLSKDPSLGLYPVVVIIDEAQELFQSDQGEEAKQLVTTILKRGRALGIIVVMSTQNPDAESLPKAADRLVMTRFALRVNDHVANNMILGSGAYSAGHRATLFDEDDKGVGLLKTGGTTFRTVRTAWLTRPKVEAIGRRALAMRTDGGRLTGDAIGQAVPNQADRLTIVADALIAAPHCPGSDRESAWLHELEDALSVQRPELYADLEQPWLGARLRAFGISTPQRNRICDGQQINRHGVTLGDLRKVLEGSDQ